MDFVAFLHDLDHRKQWKIHQLHGGLVNFTVRATESYTMFSDDQDTAPRLDLSGYHSLILKHAPPYIASVGSEAPFSQMRQVVEARALAYLGAINFPEQLCIPRLVHHDPDQFVLVMEDLGDLINLEQQLSRQDEAANQEGEQLVLANQLGISLAQLHSVPVGRALGESLYNPDARKVVFELAVKSIASRLETHGISDYGLLAERCAQHFVFTQSVCSDPDNTSALLPVFSMGDLWPPSILVDNARNRLGLVDWEFAGPSLPLADLAQLAAHLQVYSLKRSSSHAPKFLRQLIKSYAEKSVELGAPWAEPSRLRVALRAALILHGREIVNVSIESKDWPNGVDQVTGVRRGCDYLRWAGDTPKDLDVEALVQDGVFVPFCILISDK